MYKWGFERSGTKRRLRSERPSDTGLCSTLSTIFQSLTSTTCARQLEQILSFPALVAFPFLPFLLPGLFFDLWTSRTNSSTIFCTTGVALTRASAHFRKLVCIHYNKIFLSSFKTLSFTRDPWSLALVRVEWRQRTRRCYRDNLGGARRETGHSCQKWGKDVEVDGGSWFVMMSDGLRHTVAALTASPCKFSSTSSIFFASLSDWRLFYSFIVFFFLEGSGKLKHFCFNCFSFKFFGHKSS